MNRILIHRSRAKHKEQKCKRFHKYSGLSVLFYQYFRDNISTASITDVTGYIHDKREKST